MQKFQVRFKAAAILEEFKFGHDSGKMKEKQLKKHRVQITGVKTCLYFRRDGQADQKVCRKYFWRK